MFNRCFLIIQLLNSVLIWNIAEKTSSNAVKYKIHKSNCLHFKNLPPLFIHLARYKRKQAFQPKKKPYINARRLLNITCSRSYIVPSSKKKIKNNFFLELGIIWRSTETFILVTPNIHAKYATVPLLIVVTWEDTWRICTARKLLRVKLVQSCFPPNMIFLFIKRYLKNSKVLASFSLWIN